MPKEPKVRKGRTSIFYSNMRSKPQGQSPHVPYPPAPGQRTRDLPRTGQSAWGRPRPDKFALNVTTPAPSALGLPTPGSSELVLPRPGPSKRGQARSDASTRSQARAKPSALGLPTLGSSALGLHTPDSFSLELPMPGPSALDLPTPGPSRRSQAKPGPSMPGKVSPGSSALGLHTPDLFSLDLDTPDLFSLDLDTPDLFSLDLDTPDLISLNLPMPDLFSLDLDTPDLFSLDLPMPGTSALDLPTPGPSTRSQARPGPSVLVLPTPGPSTRSQARPGPSALVLPTPGPSTRSQARPGPSALVLPTPGPSTLSQARPGPSALVLPTPGPSTRSQARPGPSALVLPTAGPSTLSQARPGPSALVLPTPGPSTRSQARPGPSALVLPTPGPSTLSQARPGPSALVLPTPGPSTRSQAKPGPLTQIQVTSGPSAQGLSAPGSSTTHEPAPSSSTARASAGERRKLLKHKQLQTLYEDINIIVEANPNGIPCNNVMSAYSEYFGRDMNLKRFAMNSVMDLMPDLPVWCAVPWLSEKGLWLLVAQGRMTFVNALTSPEANGDQRTSRQDMLSIANDPNIFPEDCVQMYDSIPMNIEAYQLQPGDNFVVKMGKVYSPWRFYIMRAREGKSESSLETLEKAMRSYYTQAGRQRKLAREAVRPGHYCCIHDHSYYYRGVICRLVGQNGAQVRLIDFGDVVVVKRQQLKPLLRCWITLPAQAIRASLAQVGPAGWCWPTDATAAFKDLVRGRRVTAKVVSTDFLPCVVNVELQYIKLYIHRELLLNHHAVTFDSTVELREDYYNPSFESLESGRVQYFEAPPAHLMQRKRQRRVHPSDPFERMDFNWHNYYLLENHEQSASDIYATIYGRNTNGLQ